MCLVVVVSSLSLCVIPFTRYRSHTHIDKHQRARDPVWGGGIDTVGESSSLAPLTPLIDRLYSCVCLCVSGVREGRGIIQLGGEKKQNRFFFFPKQKKINSSGHFQ